MKVAFATTDSIRVDAHFGQAPQFVLYEVTGDGAREAGRIALADAEGQHDRLLPRYLALGGCAMVFVSAIGPEPAAVLRERGVHVVRAPEEPPIADTLSRLRHVAAVPPPWLRKLAGERGAP